MARALEITLALVASSSLCLLQARDAQAAPPGNWSLGVERIFGISRVTVDTEVNDVTTSDTNTSISLFSALSGLSGLRGYSTPRLALDYLSGSGVSFGGAFAYESTDGDSRDDNLWLVAARVGYFADVTPGFGIWPRAGLTHVAFDDNDDVDDDDPSATALTLEVPLVFMVLDRTLGLSIMPHADIGLTGGTDTVDQEVTELGLQFGLNIFF
jgi:hypothetical protein